MKLTEPSKTIFYQIEKAIKQYRTMAQKNLNELEYKITVNQILLLIQIEKQPDISQVELAELLFKDVASITRMIELLVKKGFLIRTEHRDDRRKKDLRMTQKGERLISKAIPVVMKNREIALKNISTQEINILFEVLNKINLNTSK